jgi:hypothetical protein
MDYGEHTAYVNERLDAIAAEFREDGSKRDALRRSLGEQFHGAYTAACRKTAGTPPRSIVDSLLGFLYDGLSSAEN